MHHLPAAVIAAGISALVAVVPVHQNTTTATAAVKAAVATPVLPDLTMAPLNNFQIGSDPSLPGRTLLRFNATIANIGHAGGIFEVLGSRPDTSVPLMTVQQVIHNSDNSTTTIPTTAQMVFDDGDGHHHWHVMRLESYQLTAANGTVITSPKVGYCFYDNDQYDLTLPGAPQSPVFPGCGDETSLNVDTGLSVGWGDTYPAERFEQWVDITGLPAGVYRLTAKADPNHYFTESNTNNNLTWTDLYLKNGTFTPLQSGNQVGLVGSYKVNSKWNNGFVSTIKLTNTGTTTIHSWRVVWLWDGNQKVTSAWNTKLTQSGNMVTATNASYNGTLKPGASLTFGFQAKYSGTNTAPSLSVAGS